MHAATSKTNKQTETMVTVAFGRRAVQKFIDAKCIKEEQDEDKLVNEEIWENDDFDACVFDEDKMMTHILDCYAALCAFQQYRGGMEQSNKLDAKTQQAKNKAFKISMSLMSRGMTNDDAKLPWDSSALSVFVDSFPDDTKQTDGRGWMPLHWAMLALGTSEGELHGLSEEDVKLIYAIDPLAQQRFQDSVDNREIDPDGHRYTPAHFLCMQPVTPITMSLLQCYSVCNLQALISSSYDSLSVLHAACKLGQPTEELIQHLLQLDSSQVSKKCGGGSTPLEYLCQNDCCNESLMKCFLQFDSSAAVVGGAIRACFNSSVRSSTLEKVDFLLKVNPEVVRHHFDSSQCNLLHLAVGSYSREIQLCIDIMKRIIALHPDVVRETNIAGELPIHTAAKHGSLEVVEFLLGLYPESATIVTVGKSENLLHLAASGGSNNSAIKVKYLCSRYPEFIYQRDKNGNTSLHIAMGYLFSSNVSIAKLLCEAGGQELVKMPTVRPTESASSRNGWLPLHCFIPRTIWHRFSSPLSEEAGFFRLMLRWYPEAAGIEAGNGRLKKTPYQLAVDGKLDPYYLRLLLRAAPNLNPAELHRVNFAERRMAMFMAFRAVTNGVTPLLMARLRFENKDLVKHVVSFL